MTKKGNTMAGLTSLPQKKNIKGQSHKLAYITEAESDLLKSMGGAGKPVQGTKGVPAFYSDPGDAADMGGPDASDAESAGGDSEGSMGFSAAGFDAAQQAADDESAADDFDAMSGGDQSDPSVGSVDPGDTFGGFFDPGTPEFSGWGNLDVPTTSKGAVSSIQQAGKKRGQDILDARFFSPDLLSIPQMNALEEEGFKTFGLGYRGPFEARSREGQTRTSYNPNDLTGAGTDERAYNLAMFQSFAKANRGLTTVEAVAQHNAESPGLEVSINDVQSMGFDLNAPVGPQADFREAVAQRGLAQGIGLLAAGPISGMATIATDGKGMVGMLSEVLGIEEEVEALGYGKVPSMQEVALDIFGPSKDTMEPGSFGLSPTTGVTEETIGPEAFGLADISPPTNEEIGYTDMGLGSFTLDGNEEIIPLSPQTKPIIKEEEEIIATPSPAFPTIDTVPQSRVDRIASIYNISKEAAERMLGVTA